MNIKSIASHTAINYAVLSVAQYLLSQVGYAWILKGPELGIDKPNFFLISASLGLAIVNNMVDKEEDEEKPIIVAKYTDAWHKANPSVL